MLMPTRQCHVLHITRSYKRIEGLSWETQKYYVSPPIRLHLVFDILQLETLKIQPILNLNLLGNIRQKNQKIIEFIIILFYSKFKINALCFWDYRPITNERENVYSKFLLMKSSKKYFIFSSACCLIIWLMISPKFFEKKGILKI